MDDSTKLGSWKSHTFKPALVTTSIKQ